MGIQHTKFVAILQTLAPRTNDSIKTPSEQKMSLCYSKHRSVLITKFIPHLVWDFPVSYSLFLVGLRLTQLQLISICSSCFIRRVGLLDNTITRNAAVKFCYTRDKHVDRMRSWPYCKQSNLYKVNDCVAERPSSNFYFLLRQLSTALLWQKRTHVKINNVVHKTG